MEKPDAFNFAPLVGVALAKPRPLRLKIRSRKSYRIWRRIPSTSRLSGEHSCR